MDDLISRQAAIDTVGNMLRRKFGIGGDLAKITLAGLPSAQPALDEWCTDCREYDQERHCCPRWNRVIRTALDDARKELSPVQPEERTEERTETHACDCISRQAAIEALNSINGTAELDEAFFIIENLPPAQTEAKQNANGDWVMLNKRKILQAGYEGREIDFYIGGRKFAVREKAQ